MMIGKITIADKVITAAARHMILNTDGVVAITDKAGKTSRGRVILTRDRKLIIYLICRYGANTNRIYNETADGIRRIFGDIGNIREIAIYVAGIGE